MPRKPRPTRPPRGKLQAAIQAAFEPIDVTSAVLIVASHLRLLGRAPDADVLTASLKALLVRAEVSPQPIESGLVMRSDLLEAMKKRAPRRAVIRVMSDQEIINAMDGLVQLMRREPRTAADKAYDELCMATWVAVREYVAAYVRRDSRVNPRVSGGTKKKGRR